MKKMYLCCAYYIIECVNISISLNNMVSNVLYYSRHGRTWSDVRITGKGILIGEKNMCLFVPLMGSHCSLITQRDRL